MRIKLFTVCLLLVLGAKGLLAQDPRLVLPVGHLGGVTNMKISQNGKLLLTEDLNSEVIVLDTKNLIELQRYHFDKKHIKSTFFLNDSTIIGLCNDTLIYKIDVFNQSVSYKNLKRKIKKVVAFQKDIFAIDTKNFVFKLNIRDGIFFTKIKCVNAADILPINKNNLLTINGKKINKINLTSGVKNEIKFDDEITSFDYNYNSNNIIVGFQNGSIKKLDSKLKVICTYKPLSDKISSISFIHDSIIVSGSYDFSLSVQNKTDILHESLLDDWVVSINVHNDKIYVISWNGKLISYKIEDSFIKELEFTFLLKKASYFCQKDSNLYISFNDGFVGLFDIFKNIKTEEYKICTDPILGLDVSDNKSHILTWTKDYLTIFDLKSKKTVRSITSSDIVSGKFFKNSRHFVFANTSYLYKVLDDNIDSFEIENSWTLRSSIDNKIISSGLNKIILLNLNESKVYNFKDIGTIWTTANIEKDEWVLGTSDGKLITLDTNGTVSHTSKFELGIVEIIISNNLIFFLSGDGCVRLLDLKTKKIKLIAESQEFGCWDFLVNNIDQTILFPNASQWNNKMELSKYNFSGNLLFKSGNKIDGKIVCISNSNNSLNYNLIDSTEVIFIVSDGTVRKIIYNKPEIDNYLSSVGYEYFNFLNNNIAKLKLDKVSLKSGLLELQINKNTKMTYVQLKNNDWLVYDEHYRYDGSQGARDYLYFVCGLEVVDLAQVKDALYVPNLLQRIMNGENLEHLPKLKDLELCGVTPEVELLENKKDGGHYYQINPRKGGIGQVEIYINGMLRQTIDSKTLPQKNGIYELKLDEKLISQYQISEQETTIKVIARTADNKISSRGVISEVKTEAKTYRKPSIHAIMVGIDDYKGEGLDLNYAAKDAIDLQTVLEKSARKFFNIDDTNRVHFYPLTLNKSGTINGLTPDRNNILQTIDKIAQNSKPEDLLLFFFAGHGEVNKDNNFMLLTADAAKEQAPNYIGISMKELLVKLAIVPAGKRVLILDACHSGAAINELNLIDVAGLRDVEDSEKQSQRLKQLENLASKSGLAIITASSSSQKALELPQYEHGLMTYALLSTMLSSPEVLDKDSNLQLEDWLRETEKSVAKLIENQSVQRFVPLNFSLGKVDLEVRNSINLYEIPILFVDNVLCIGTGDDNLDIKSKLKQIFETSAARNSADKILLAERENTKSIAVNITYESEQEKINCRITLTKNKVKLRQFNFSGLNSNLKVFVNALAEVILKNVRN